MAQGHVCFARSIMTASSLARWSVLLQEVFSSLTKHWQLLLGGTIVLLVLFLPGGLAKLTSRFRRGLLGPGQ